MADINHLKLEIKDYIRHQSATGTFARNGVANRTAVLNRWADDMDVAEVRAIATERPQKWYEWLKQRKAEPLTETTGNYLIVVV